MSATDPLTLLWRVAAERVRHSFLMGEPNPGRFLDGLSALVSGLSPIQYDRPGLALLGPVRGETGGYSVYLMRLSDGTAYVGITGGSIATRVESHMHETPAVRERFRDGCTAWVYCLASGLTERQARDRERIEVGKLDKPLNVLLVNPAVKRLRRVKGVS